MPSNDRSVTFLRHATVRTMHVQTVMPLACRPWSTWPDMTSRVPCSMLKLVDGHFADVPAQEGLHERRHGVLHVRLADFFDRDVGDGPGRRLRVDEGGPLDR